MPRILALILLASTLLAGCLSGEHLDPTVEPDHTPTFPVVPSPTPVLSPTESAVDESPLAGTSWRLVEMAGEAVDITYRVTAVFDEEGIQGSGGCNSYGGGYTANPATGEFRVNEVAITAEACAQPPGVLNIERDFYRLLHDAIQYELANASLILTNAQGSAQLVFVQVEDGSPSAGIPPSEVDPEPTSTTPIAEYGNWEIYVMDADGSNQHRPAPSLAGENWPSWMPDGRLAFQSNRTGEQRLFAVDPDGSDLQELPIDLASITSRIEWSADGSQIFYASNIDGLEQIYVADADGSNPRRITEIAEGTSSPDWSTDGSKVVFTNRSHGPAVIYSINTDGTNLQRLTFDQEATEDAPVWSPEGIRIAFGHFSNDGDGGIFIMDADGSNIRRLTDGGSWIDSLPSWSPDGTRIAFNREQDIWVINIDGSGLQQLTDSPFADEWPVWSPDGSQIAFISNRDGGQPVNCSFTTIVDYVWMESLDQVAWLSEQIIVGEVVEQFPSVFGPVEDRSGIEQTYPIFTDYLIEVDTWIRGVPSSTLRLRRPGGIIGECVQTYEGEPEIEIGNRILLFMLTDDLNPTLPPASLMLVGEQAFWPVGDDGEVENEWFPEYDGTEIDDLAAAIRDLLRQPEPDYFNLVPLDESPVAEDGGEP